MSRLDEIRARCEAATVGPWRPRDSLTDTADVCTDVISKGNGNISVCIECDLGIEDDSPDAVFISWAREDLPWCLDEIERLRSNVSALQEMILCHHETIYIPANGPRVCQRCHMQWEHVDGVFTGKAPT